jgi:hypothetical protein
LAVLGFEPRAFTFSHFTFFEMGLAIYLPGLVLNRGPPDLCLPSSWDYRREPPTPGNAGNGLWFGKNTHFDAT